MTEPRRIFVAGPSGSGKSTVARQLGAALGLPVHELDLVYREAGGNSPLRPDHERQAKVARILASDGWVVEGVHLGWTAELLAAADVIVWLDHLSTTATRGRVLRRFVDGALESARTERGARRFLRLKDYGRHLRELVGAMRQARRYDAQARGADDAPSRAETERALRPYGDRVMRCSTQAEVESVSRRLTDSGVATTTTR